MLLNELFLPANVTRWSKRGDKISKKRADRYGIRQHSRFSPESNGEK